MVGQLGPRPRPGPGAADLPEDNNSIGNYIGGIRKIWDVSNIIHFSFIKFIEEFYLDKISFIKFANAVLLKFTLVFLIIIINNNDCPS